MFQNLHHLSTQLPDEKSLYKLHFRIIFVILYVNVISILNDLSINHNEYEQTFNNLLCHRCDYLLSFSFTCGKC